MTEDLSPEAFMSDFNRLVERFAMSAGMDRDDAARALIYALTPEDRDRFRRLAAALDAVKISRHLSGAQASYAIFDEAPKPAAAYIASWIRYGERR